MAPPTKLAAERCAKDGRFSYPPDLQEKVAAYRRARKLSALIQDAIRRAPWPPEEKEGDKNMPYGFSERMMEAAEEQFSQDGRACSKCCTESTPENPVTWGPDPFAEEIDGDGTPIWECQKCRDESADEI